MGSAAGLEARSGQIWAWRARVISMLAGVGHGGDGVRWSSASRVELQCGFPYLVALLLRPDPKVVLQFELRWGRPRRRDRWIMESVPSGGHVGASYN